MTQERLKWFIEKYVRSSQSEIKSIKILVVGMEVVRTCLCHNIQLRGTLIAKESAETSLSCRNGSMYVGSMDETLVNMIKSNMYTITCTRCMTKMRVTVRNHTAIISLAPIENSRRSLSVDLSRTLMECFPIPLRQFFTPNCIEDEITELSVYNKRPSADQIDNDEVENDGCLLNCDENDCICPIPKIFGTFTPYILLNSLFD